MSRTLSSRSLTGHRVLHAILGVALLSALAFATTACEDKAIGRPCFITADAGAMQALFEGQALECPTRMCLKPSRDQAVAKPVDTSPYCTAPCSKDSDCDGERRDKSNPRDKRCEGGFVCGVATETGSLCCTKVCLCKDFLSVPQGGLQTPASCKPGGVSSCANL